MIPTKVATVNLKEILHPKMDVLFIALNPAEGSNYNGHYFSHNLSLWNLLYDSNLIIQRVTDKLSGDDEVFRGNAINHKRAIFGITDLVHDVVKTDSRSVPVNKSRVQRILNILENHDVKIACIMHSKVARIFERQKMVKRRPEYGEVGKYNDTLLFEVPFHSAGVPDKKVHYGKLTDKLSSIK